MRSVQKEVAIVLAPELADVREVAIALNVQGVVDIPIPIRMLIPVIERAASEVYDTLPETVKAPAIDLPQETVYIETLVDELLGDDETPYFTSRQIRAQSRNLFNDDTDDKPKESNTLEVVIESNPDGDTTARVKQPKESDSTNRSMSLFQKLASEEPPMPGFGENGTISDLARSVSQGQLDENETEAQPIEDSDIPQDDADDGESAPAILVLQTALDQTTPVEAISLKTLYENIQERLPADQQNIRPLPSWLKEGEKFVREPIFLPETLPPLETMRPMEYTSTLTQPSESAVVISNTGDLDTEVIHDDLPHLDDEPVDAIDEVDSSDDEHVDELELPQQSEPIEIVSDDDFR